MGPFRFVVAPEGAAAPPDLEERLPRRNSLRRAGEEARMAVVAAVEALAASDLKISDRVGVYVGQQQGALDACAQFVRATYREGPRLASPMLFSESVANNTATHLSLTLGVKGAVQTFIGSRPAGIQAVAAAREDLEGGVVDAGLVVILGAGTGVTRDAYGAVFRPATRGAGPVDLPFLRGAVAFVMREGSGVARVDFASVRCLGRGARQGEAVRSLWREWGGAASSCIASTFRLSAAAGRRAIEEGTGCRLEPPTALPECFALDPFLQLGQAAPAAGPRPVVCLSEEGTAGLLVVS
jgi:hypothetical protein